MGWLVKQLGVNWLVINLVFKPIVLANIRKFLEDDDHLLFATKREWQLDIWRVPMSTCGSEPLWGFHGFVKL